MWYYHPLAPPALGTVLPWAGCKTGGGCVKSKFVIIFTWWKVGGGCWQCSPSPVQYSGPACNIHFILLLLLLPSEIFLLLIHIWLNSICVRFYWLRQDGWMIFNKKGKERNFPICFWSYGFEKKHQIQIMLILTSFSVKNTTSRVSDQCCAVPWLASHSITQICYKTSWTFNIDKVALENQ